MLCMNTKLKYIFDKFLFQTSYFLLHSQICLSRWKIYVSELSSPVEISKSKINTQKTPFRKAIITVRNHYRPSHHATQTKGKHFKVESNIFFSKFSRAGREVTLSTSQQRGNSVYLPSLRGS